MKLRPDKLLQHLKSSLKPLYLVSGDEPLLIQECCDTIRSAGREQGFSEREVMYVESGFDWDELAMQANSYSLFANKKLLELRLASLKLGDKGFKALQNYAKDPNPDTLLLITTPKLTPANQKSKWFNCLDQTGIILQVWPVAIEQLPAWIAQRLRSKNLTAEPDALRLIAQRVEGNLLAATQEIEKLALMNAETTITTKMVATSVANSGRFNIFNLADYALSGKANETLTALNGLRNEGHESTLVLWALSREIRSLLEIQHAVSQGIPVDQILQKQRVMEKRRPIIKAALKRLTASQLMSLLQQAQQVDQCIKGISKENPWDKLVDLALYLAKPQTFLA